MKKIAYLISAFPVMSETFVGNEIRAIQRLNHDVELFSFEHKSEPAQSLDIVLAKQLIILAEVGFVDTLHPILHSPIALQSAMQFVNQQQGLPKRSLLWYGAKLASQVIRKGCQHIHAHFGLASTATAIVAARLANVSVSFTCHGYDIYRTPADLALKLSSANFAVAVSDIMKRDMQELSTDANVIRVRCGVDITQINSNKVMRYDSKKLLYLGRLSETKGVNVLLDAMAIVNADIRPQLDIVGDGPLREDLEKQCQHLNLTPWVRFLGAKPATWLDQHHDHYQCLVAPFVVTPAGVKDTGPLVLKEAMMYRLPILTTDMDACQEMLLDEQGQMPILGKMVAADNPFSLAAGIALMTNKPPHELKAMGETGAAFLEQHFLIDQQVKILSQAIESCHQEAFHANSMV
ncbi:glycosyltransferase family 4 protein [Marinomonas transparens]|uniref:Glycosyltransferase family 4 protein n=1 Tax=Marinomonas transparens TaxID=2795388 RepID=A0A934JR25_9GAMM|nr:glycosyltransferase family 4 protein [Marinomonas transparens]MBJ7538248.1 glycosyltransferase family 4 protein [Marinomonas transparens]